jgi:hypothetical protein
LLTDFGLLDLVFHPAGTVNGYADLFKESTPQMIGNCSVKCITEEQWVELKSSTGRQKDLEHLRQYFAQRVVKKND